jgi:hypothetical protein
LSTQKLTEAQKEDWLLYITEFMPLNGQLMTTLEVTEAMELSWFKRSHVLLGLTELMNRGVVERTGTRSCYYWQRISELDKTGEDEVK